MVASGLLISCMMPAASWPMAASFSLCMICTCIARHSVTSSPMVMTWVMRVAVEPHRDLAGAEVAHLAALRHLDLDLLDRAGLEDAVELRLEVGRPAAG